MAPLEHHQHYSQGTRLLDDDFGQFYFFDIEKHPMELRSLHSGPVASSPVCLNEDIPDTLRKDGPMASLPGLTPGRGQQVNSVDEELSCLKMRNLLAHFL